MVWANSILSLIPKDILCIADGKYILQVLRGKTFHYFKHAHRINLSATYGEIGLVKPVEGKMLQVKPGLRFLP